MVGWITTNRTVYVLGSLPFLFLVGKNTNKNISNSALPTTRGYRYTEKRIDCLATCSDVAQLMLAFEWQQHMVRTKACH
jgi:hypothetical protein